MPAIPIIQFEAKLLRHYAAKGRAEKTTRQIHQVLRELQGIGVARTCHVNTDAIDRWIVAWPDRTPQTFRSHLRCLSAICTRLKIWRYIRVDPFEADGVATWMRLDSRPSAPRRRWSKPADQVRAVLALATQEAASGSWEAARLEAYVHTLFMTGARPGEIQRLRIIDLDIGGQTITICPHMITGRGGRHYWWRPKTVGAAGIIPIGDRLTGILGPWSRRVQWDSRRGKLRITGCESLFPGKRLWGPWTGGGPGESPLDQVKALGERAGVPDLTCKAARKGLGTYRDIGLTPQGRRERFRHSDDATGDLYDEHDAEARREDAIKIERFFTGT